MKKKINRIKKSISRINNPKPEDDFILTYSDFLVNRDSLPFYQFNPRVLESLLDITLELWQTPKRISRISLLESIRRYTADKERYYYNERNKILSSSEIRIRMKLFVLFRRTFEETDFLSSKQISEAQKIANSLLINIALSEKEEEWLCINYSKSEVILNRLLRYPAKSKIISAWVQRNFHSDYLRSRRAELISWFLDKDPIFQLNELILWEDFQYFNSIDQRAVQEVKERFEINRLLANNLGNGEESDKLFDIPGIQFDANSDLDVRPLVLSKRFYQVPTRFSDDYLESFPDFEKLNQYFNDNLKTFLQVTMMWAIGYSRLTKEEKSELLIRQYGSESENTFFKICERWKLTEPLEWLIQKQ